MTRIGIAIVEREDCFLIGIRPEKGPLPGYHEFPGGKQHPKESTAQTAIRECREETGLEVSAVKLIHQTSFQYVHDKVELDFWLCELRSSEDADRLSSTWRWISRSHLASLNFPPANTELIEQLITSVDSFDAQI